MTKLSTAQIGKAGELLVQYRLLLHGIESAHLTTDAGIDLVAYTPSKSGAVTVQVKTNLKPKPAGGKGSPALDWWVPKDTPAELIALVDLSAPRVWLMTRQELLDVAQQQATERFHIYMYIDPVREPARPGSLVADFNGYSLENQVGRLF